jgi:putative FmdB family regulatory protein
MNTPNNQTSEVNKDVMPLFEFLCVECGATSEVLVASSDESPSCKACGSVKLKKLLSAPSSLSGGARQGLPGPSDTACCGTSPTQAGCAGPGSCCGKNPF